MKRIVIYGPEEAQTRQLERALREDNGATVGIVIVDGPGTLSDELYPAPGDVVVFTTVMYPDVLAHAQGNGCVVFGLIHDGTEPSPAFQAPS